MVRTRQNQLRSAQTVTVNLLRCDPGGGRGCKCGGTANQTATPFVERTSTRTSSTRNPQTQRESRAPALALSEWALVANQAPSSYYIIEYIMHNYISISVI